MSPAALQAAESQADDGWLVHHRGGGRDVASLKADVAALMRTAKVVHVTDVIPTASPLDFWREVGGGLGRNAELIEDAATLALVSGPAWMDVRFEPGRPDTFRHHNVGQPLHTDGAYVADTRAREVTLFYLERQANEGGESLFIDAASIAACARARDPDLYARLIGLPVGFGKAGGAMRISPILYWWGGRAKVNWNYYRVLPNQGEAIDRLREDFRTFLESLVEGGDVAAFRLEPGDAVFFLDEEVLHGRKGFAATESGERLLWKTYFTRKAV